MWILGNLVGIVMLIAFLIMLFIALFIDRKEERKMNKFNGIGRITNSIELKKTGSGTSVVSFTLAINRRVQAGAEPQADYITCVAWNKTAEHMAQYLHKGSLIGVEGRIQTRNYDKEGTRIYVTEVVADSVQFLEPRNKENYSVEEVKEEYSSVDYDELSSEDLPF